MKYNWTLNTINHTYLDRIKIAFFFLDTRNRWTIGKRVRQFEEEYAKYLGVKYVVATSSGSTANSVLSHWHYDKNKESIKNGRNQVIFNGITWATSCNSFIRDGFEPVFIDINLTDFSIDYDKLEEYLKNNHEKVSCLFITNLIGYGGDIERLDALAKKYGVKLMFDNCESGNSFYRKGLYEWKHIGQDHTHTHSFYLGHLFNGCEMGCIATNSEEEYQEFLMYRNHGLIRVIKDLDNVKNKLFEKVQNKLVDDAFSFARMGNNYRPVEINSYIASLDLKRKQTYKEKRDDLFVLFQFCLNPDKFYLPYENNSVDNTHFCLPIIISPKYKESKVDLIEKVKQLLKDKMIESRPIISQTLTRQSIYQQYGDYRELENCEYLTKFGMYIGLHPSVKESQVIDICSKLNKL